MPVVNDKRKKKSIFKSKTFWFNVLSIGSSITGALPLDPNVVAIAVGAINIVLRKMTDQGVSIAPRTE